MTIHSSLASVSATRQRLAELGLSTKKYLGQHFLVDDGVVGRIVRLAALDVGTRVVEVGPGLGTLSEALLATGAHLTAIELDAALSDGLRQRYPELTLLIGDALDEDTLAYLKQLEPEALVANLPYAVAATLLLDYFQHVPSIGQATVMMQREVAERVAAKPGTKEYGAYTIKLQLHAEVKASFDVAPQCFYPPPRVHSTVIRLERVVLAPHSLISLASMLADAAFFQRRKTLRNSMSAYFAEHPQPTLPLDTLLAEAQVDPRARGETLSKEDFLALAEIARQLSRTSASS